MQDANSTNTSWYSTARNLSLSNLQCFILVKHIKCLTQVGLLKRNYQLCDWQDRHIQMMRLLMVTMNLLLNYLKKIDSSLLWVLQEMSKNISDTLSCIQDITSLFSPYFDIICDILPNRCMASLNLSIKQVTNSFKLLLTLPNSQK